MRGMGESRGPQGFDPGVPRIFHGRPSEPGLMSAMGRIATFLRSANSSHKLLKAE